MKNYKSCTHTELPDCKGCPDLGACLRGNGKDQEKEARVKIPDHELSNYRIALAKYNEFGTRYGWTFNDRRQACADKLHERVIGNALRLAEALDRNEKKARES